VDAAPDDGAVEGSCRCSGPARRWRRAPLDLAKTKGRVRPGRTHVFQRAGSREERGRSDGNLYRAPERSSNKIELSPVRESQGVGCGFGWRGWGAGVQMSERTGERGGSGVFIWRGGLGDRPRWSWRSGLAVVGMSGGVSMLGSRVHGEQVLEGRERPEVLTRTRLPYSHICARRCSTVAAAI
jgi:hypothetical protein